MTCIGMLLRTCLESESSKSPPRLLNIWTFVYCIGMKRSDAEGGIYKTPFTFYH